MPYLAEHKRDTREKILESARRLFNREGFAGAQRGGEAVKVAYQEVVEQLVKVFEDNLNEPQAHECALALVALCVGGMVLAKNVGDPDLADDFRQAAHAAVLRSAGWSSHRRRS
jgi:hypothetical protein